MTQSHDGGTGGYGFVRKAEMSVVVLSVLPVSSIRIERMILKRGGAPDGDGRRESRAMAMVEFRRV